MGFLMSIILFCQRMTPFRRASRDAAELIREGRFDGIDKVVEVEELPRGVAQDVHHEREVLVFHDEVEDNGVEKLSRSRISRLGKSLDEEVDDLR